MKKENLDFESKWNESVSKAKQLYNERNKNQMLVAKLALDVCDISWGGNKKNTDAYTLKRFSEEAGIKAKQLSSWICVRKNVYDKLTNEQQCNDKLNYTCMARAATQLVKESSHKEVQKILDTIVHGNDVNRAIFHYLKDIRSIAYNFQNKDAAIKCEEGLVKEIYFYANVIIRNIKKQQPEFKPEDRGLAGSTSIKGLTISKAFDIPRDHSGTVHINDAGQKIKITPKDRDIVNYIKNNSKFFSPTEIGMKVGKHNSDNATAWACRTLNKLQSLDLVERNTKGHYKWVG